MAADRREKTARIKLVNELGKVAIAEEWTTFSSVRVLPPERYATHAMQVYWLKGTRLDREGVAFRDPTTGMLWTRVARR